MIMKPICQSITKRLRGDRDKPGKKRPDPIILGHITFIYPPTKEKLTAFVLLHTGRDPRDFPRHGDLTVEIYRDDDVIEANKS